MGMLLACIDAIAAAVCVVLAYKLRFYPHGAWGFDLLGELRQDQSYFHLLLAAPFVRMLCGYVVGVYRVRRRAYRLGEDIPRLAAAVSLGSAIFVLAAFFGVLQYQAFFEYRTFSYTRFFFVFDWLLNLLAVIGAHSLVKVVRTDLCRRGVGTRRTAIQGMGAEARALATAHERLQESGYRVVGFITNEPKKHEKHGLKVDGRNIKRLGDTKNLLDVINRHHLEEIVVTEVSSLGMNLLEFCDTCRKLGVLVRLVPDVYGLLFQGQPVEEMAGLPVIQANEISIVGLPRLVKRAEDIMVSLAGLACLSPLLILTAACVKAGSPGPVFFVQQRVGKNGRTFPMIKFRSMYQDAEARRQELDAHNESNGVLFKMKDDPRVTRIGKWIRRTSIDELPQLFNVLRGEMSLIGPRPLPASDVARPEEWDYRRFVAVPGLTGMWQVNRIEHTAEEMLKWDLYYVENWSLWLDLKILVKTFYVVLTGKGAY